MANHNNAMRPFPKPSIGAKESFCEGVEDSIMDRDKSLTPMLSKKPPRYAQSDADLINADQEPVGRNTEKVEDQLNHIESFEHLSADLLNITPPADDIDGLEPKQDDLMDDVPNANPLNDGRSSDTARDT